MTLRRTFILYLLVIHLIVASILTVILWDKRIWIVGIEAFLLGSFLVATRLFRRLFRPLDLLSASVEFLREKDFSIRLVETGPPEMDRLIGVYNQMVDTLRTERLAIQEQHYFLDKILQVSPSAILIFDHDDRVSYANPAALSLFRRSGEELVGRKINEVEATLFAQMEGMKSGDSAIYPIQGSRKVLCRKSNFIDRGHPRTFYLFEELTEELRKTEKVAYEKLIRMLSHEVNNSLGAASSLLQSCMHYSGQINPDDRKDFESALSVAIARTEHLNSFMKGFADILRLPQPRLTPTDVCVPLSSITTLVHADLEKRRIILRKEFERTSEPIPMDPHQMEQVFLNILKNSIEAIDMDGTITIRVGMKNGRDFVSIEDNGRGISEEVRQQLFTPFFSTKANGQGIGLTLVQEILARHQFDFSLDSSPGGPTRFLIYLSRGRN